MGLKLNRWRSATLALAALAASSGSMQACTNPEPAHRRRELTFVTGSVGSDNDRLGQVLAQKFSANPAAAAVVSPQRTSGTIFNIQAIQQGHADIAFAHSDFAYLAYKRGTENQVTRARGIAVLLTSAVQIVVREDSAIQAVPDLRNHRIVIGSSGNASEIAAHAIFASYGLRANEINLRPLDDSDDRFSLIENRSVDGGIFVRSVLIDATNTPGFRLIELDHQHVNLIRGRYPFYKPVTVPRGTYPEHTRDIRTIGIDTLIVCREDLPEELVYQLTRVFFESLSDLKRAQPYSEFVDPEQVSASSIPLHPGAARFYRERELQR